MYRPYSTAATTSSISALPAPLLSPSKVPTQRSILHTHTHILLTSAATGDAATAAVATVVATTATAAVATVVATTATATALAEGCTVRCSYAPAPVASLSFTLTHATLIYTKQNTICDKVLQISK